MEASGGHRDELDRYRRALAVWVDWVQRHAVLVIMLAIALTVAALVHTATTLGINTSTTDIISSEVPFRRNNVAFAIAFPELRDLLTVVVDGPSPEAADDAATRLADRLRADTDNFHDIYLPGSEPYLRRNGLLFLDAEELAALADRLALIEPLLASLAADPTLRGLTNVLELALPTTDEDGAAELAGVLQEMTAVAVAIPAGEPRALSWQSLLTDGGEGRPARRFVLARPILDRGGLKPAADAMQSIRDAAGELGIDARSGLSARVTGGVALDQEELDSVELGGRTAGVLSLVMVAILLVIGLRSGSLVFATVATLLIGLIWTAGFATLAVGELNLISVAFAVLFVGLGVDFGIHMCLRYREELAGEAAKADAIRRAGGAVGGALALSALSAAAGFYAFLPTDYRGLAELGLIAGTGMFLALVANLTVLPALLAVLPQPRARPWRGMAGLPLERLSRPVLLAAAVLAVAAVITVPFARFDFNPLNLKDPRTESVSTYLDLVADPDTTPYTIRLLAEDPDRAAAVAERVAAAPETERAIALTSFVPKAQEQKLAIIEDMAFFLGPALFPGGAPPAPSAEERRQALVSLRGALAAAAGAGGMLAPTAAALEKALAALPGEDGTVAELERRLTAHLPRALDQLRAALEAQPVTLDDIPPELRRRWQNDDGVLRIEVQPGIPIRDNSDLRRFADAVLELEPTASGGPVTITEAGRVVLRAFLEALGLAFVLISLILLIVLRRFSDIVLVLVPLALAALLTIAASVVLGLSFNFANVIVLPLLLGLGVSSSIHLVMRRREEGAGTRVLSSSTPRAVLFSSLTTVAAFGSLAVSGHRGMTSMGQLLTIAIAFVLLATLVVLPSLMTVLGRRTAAPPPPPP